MPRTRVHNMNISLDGYAAGEQVTFDAPIANAHVRRWLDEVANARVHATTKVIPAVRLAEERAVMLPAPALRCAPRLGQRVAMPVTHGMASCSSYAREGERALPTLLGGWEGHANLKTLPRATLR